MIFYMIVNPLLFYKFTIFYFQKKDPGLVSGVLLLNMIYAKRNALYAS